MRPKFVLVSLFVLMAFPSELFGQGIGFSTSIASCATVQNDIARLQCFDQLAEGAAKSSKNAGSNNQSDHGHWMVNEGSNPLDDSKTATAILLADSGANEYGTPVGLAVRCRSGKIEFLLNWNAYIADDEAYVTTRVGNTNAQTALWHTSSNNQATFLPSDAKTFVGRLLNANRFVARVTPYGENPITAVFALDGMSSALKPVRQYCDWNGDTSDRSNGSGSHSGASKSAQPRPKPGWPKDAVSCAVVSPTGDCKTYILKDGSLRPAASRTGG